jgi:hypothetical protein
VFKVGSIANLFGKGVFIISSQPEDDFIDFIFCPPLLFSLLNVEWVNASEGHFIDSFEGLFVFAGIFHHGSASECIRYESE